MESKIERIFICEPQGLQVQSDQAQNWTLKIFVKLTNCMNDFMDLNKRVA